MKCNKFDESKRYKFSKNIFLTKPGRATRYKNSPVCREWVNEADGQEVQVIDELEGRVEGKAVGYFVIPEFCEEIIPHLTQVVREVANQRYKTALQKALERHPEMVEDKIIWYGCPDVYRVGKKPSWCTEDVLKTVDQCRGCWNQKGEER